MSQRKLSKQEAQRQVDEILENQFNLLVDLTYNELITRLNEGISARKTIIKGHLTSGFSPWTEMTVHLPLNFEEIYDIWSSVISSTDPELIVYFPSKYNIYCYTPSEHRKRFDLGFDFSKGSFLFFKSPMTKLFIAKLTQKIAPYGFKISVSQATTFLRIKYSCQINPNQKAIPTLQITVPSNSEKNESAAKGMTIAEARQAFSNYFMELDCNAALSNTENGARCTISNVKMALPFDRNVSFTFDISIDTSPILSIVTTVGLIPSSNLEIVQKMADEYNETDPEFNAQVVPESPVGAQLMFMRMMNCPNTELLEVGLAHFFPKIIELYKQPEVEPFASLTVEM